MGLLRRAWSLNWLVAALTLVYPPLRFIPAGALVAAMLLVGGLGVVNYFWVGPSVTLKARRAVPRPQAAPPAASVGRIPTTFTLTDRRGEERMLSSLLVAPRTVLYVYSPFCGHCASMLPKFTEFARRMQSAEIPVVGVQWQGSDATLNGEPGASSPGNLLADPKGSLCVSIGVGEFTVFIVAPDGAVFHRSGGGDLDALQLALLEERGGTFQ